jgi:hypothetical protein
MSLEESEVDLFYVEEDQDAGKQTDTELMVKLKKRAELDYERKGLHILGFEVLSIKSNTPEIQVAPHHPHLHLHHAHNKTKQSISARVKLQTAKIGALHVAEK